MAKIMNVDYEAIPGQAKQIRATAKQLNSEMTKAYNSIAEMHNSWYGKRYNELVKLFNNMIPELNDMLTLVVTEIPFALETIANNYAQADKGANVTSASNEAPNKLTNISISNDVGMRFLTSNVSTTQKQVSTNFKNAKEQMNKVESIYGTIKWSSEAADAFKAKFSKLKASIVASFENINSQFTKLMLQTQQDIEASEKSNTVN